MNNCDYFYLSKPFVYLCMDSSVGLLVNLYNGSNSDMSKINLKEYLRLGLEFNSISKEK